MNLKPFGSFIGGPRPCFLLWETNDSPGMPSPTPRPLKNKRGSDSLGQEEQRPFPAPDVKNPLPDPFQGQNLISCVQSAHSLSDKRVDSWTMPISALTTELRIKLARKWACCHRGQTVLGLLIYLVLDLFCFVLKSNLLYKLQQVNKPIETSGF